MKVEHPQESMRSPTGPQPDQKGLQGSLRRKTEDVSSLETSSRMIVEVVQHGRLWLSTQRPGRDMSRWDSFYSYNNMTSCQLVQHINYQQLEVCLIQRWQRKHRRIRYIQ